MTRTHASAPVPLIAYRAFLVAALSLALWAVPGIARAADSTRTAILSSEASAAAVPTTSSIAAAEAWIGKRRGVAGCAVVASDGKLYGWGRWRRFDSMSVVKPMLLVAYLRSHKRLSSWARRTLTKMITVSDNNAASAIFAVVGARGLRSVARVAHMKRFSVGSSWSHAQLCAADQANFFYRMDSHIPKQHVSFAHYALSHITPAHAWGVPRVARKAGWASYTKGGWSGTSKSQIVHSVGRLVKHGLTISIAVLTSGNKTQSYGIETIEGFTARVLGLVH